MKLYKITGVFYDHGVSVFSAEDAVLPPEPEMAGEPMMELIRKLVFKGYTEEAAYHTVLAWMIHAKYQLNQAARGVRVYCEMCEEMVPFSTIPPSPILWTVVIGIAIAVALALGLYLWVTLDTELSLLAPGHDWAYLMSYEERIWRAEIWNVGYLQEGVYEQEFVFHEPLRSRTQPTGMVWRFDDLWLGNGGYVMKGRKLIFYHWYRVYGFRVYFCGVMSKFGYNTYKLREGGHDPYKPTGVWTRPGGFWFAADYEGCWTSWWWL